MAWEISLVTNSAKDSETRGAKRDMQNAAASVRRIARK
jgi:hypothetical protein